MTEHGKTPFTIHSVDPSGLYVPKPHTGDAFAAPASQPVFPGQSIEISEATYAATQDRFGSSWLDLTEDEQVSRWGIVRFRLGEAPQELVDAVAAKRKADAVTARTEFLRMNPQVLHAVGKSSHLAALDAIIEVV